MDGAVVAVLGGSSGVGLAVARSVARLGAQVVVVSRSRANGDRAVGELAAVPGATAPRLVVGSLEDASAARNVVAAVVEQAGNPDAVFSTAGTVGERGLDRAGIPRAFVSNYLVHFRLVHALLSTAPAVSATRVLIVGAAPALIRRLPQPALRLPLPTAPGAATGQALAWKLLLAHAVADRYPSGPTVNLFHPGLIRSNLLREKSAPMRVIGGLFNRFGAHDSAVADRLAVSPSLAHVTGKMFDNHGHEVSLPSWVTETNAATAWRLSESLA